MSDFPGAGGISDWPLSLLSTPKSRLFAAGDDKLLKRLTLAKTPCSLGVCPEQLGRLSGLQSSEASREDGSCFGLGWSSEGPIRDKKTSVTL